MSDRATGIIRRPSVVFARLISIIVCLLVAGLVALLAYRLPPKNGGDGGPSGIDVNT